jgi:hypothetical protein
VQVFEDQHQGLDLALAQQDPTTRVERPVPALGRVEGEPVGIRAGAREQRGQRDQQREQGLVEGPEPPGDPLLDVPGVVATLDRFCRRCGRILAGVEVASRSLTARLLSSGLLMSGERKQVTVLFADLKGSMELLIDRDPEEARRILDPVLERMIAAVHRYEGTVNQVMGDGIMALFGAPLAHERITRSAPAKRPSGCRRRSATTRRHFSGRRRSRSAYGSA